MLRPINTEEVLQELDRQCSGRGNGIKTAERFDYSYEHLRQIKAGVRFMSQELAEKLGFELRWIRKEK